MGSEMCIRDRYCQRFGLSMVCYHRGSRSPETACFSAPASRLGGEAPGFWQYDRRREAAAGAAALDFTPVEPPPNVAENNNMTIRRIYYYNKTSFLFPALYVLHESGGRGFLSTEFISHVGLPTRLLSRNLKGQTFGRIGLDLRSDVFANGNLMSG